jgi:1,4-dihydroxy-2-naphthoyl-CoA hydrolase
MEYKGTPLENTMMEHLAMEVVEMGPDRVVMKMPVGPKVHQPYGLLHGGGAVALAESAASIGTALNIDREKQWALGQEINTNLLRSVSEGWVTAVATPLHRGRRSMVWQIENRTDDGTLVAVSRCTLAVVPRRAQEPVP